MISTYDQKTLNRVYSVIKRKVKKMDLLYKGFDKEAKRYLKIGDKENHLNALNIRDAFDLASQELQFLHMNIKLEFKGKTKKQKSYVKPKKSGRKV